MDKSRNYKDDDLRSLNMKNKSEIDIKGEPYSVYTSNKNDMKSDSVQCQKQASEIYFEITEVKTEVCEDDEDFNLEDICNKKIKFCEFLDNIVKEKKDIVNDIKAFEIISASSSNSSPGFLNDENNDFVNENDKTIDGYQLETSIFEEEYQSEKRFICSLCKYQSNRKDHFSRHLLTHSNKKFLKCSDCDYECNRNCDLKEHSLTHLDLKLLKCSECDYECNRKSHLQLHLLTHTNEKFLKCSKCNYETKRKSNLKNHLLSHSDKKLFKCSECDYECNFKVSLRRHLLNHSNTKPIECSNCDYKCISKWDLKIHLISHSNTKSFKCTECDREFKHRHNVKKHMLTHSKKKVSKGSKSNL